MIKGISMWAGSITIAVIIVTILEMILPESKNKKYIKTIMGVYILFTIISPIVKAVSNNQIDLENIIDTQTKINSINNNSLQTSSSIETVYESNLKKDIYAKLKQKGYEVQTITVKYEKQDDDNFGKIYEMYIEVIGNEDSKENKSTIPKIEILIGNTGLKKELSNNSITETEKNDLKRYLSSIYDVQVQNITIKEVSS